MTTLKFALMGCGRIAKKHAEVITTKLLNGRLAAVCDVDIEKAKAFGDEYNVPFYQSINDLLENEKIDVVNILTPSGLHAKHTLIVAPYKKHIVVEKPMALTLEDADLMINVCDKYQIKLFVVKQNRYNLPVTRLRKALIENRFGKLVLGTVRVRWCRNQTYYNQDAWRGTWAMDGGVLANQASHHIDLLEWMMGDVESVYAKSTTRLVDIEAEDTSVVLLKFRNGALGVVEATTATRPKDLEGSISILGEKGTVEIGGFAVNEMKIWNFVESVAGDKDDLLSFSENPSDVYGFGHVMYLQDAVKSILDDAEPFVDGVAGRKSLELITAIYESIESGKEVDMSSMSSKCRLGQLYQ